MPIPAAPTFSCATAHRFGKRWEWPRLTPLASAIAVLAVAGTLAGNDARAQPRPFSSSWMAAKGAAQAQAAASGKLPNGMPANANSSARQQQEARQQLSRSVTNLGTAAAAIAAQQAAQVAARATARQGASVPDGLAEGGLKVDTRLLTGGWLNAKSPSQTESGGRITVAIEQTGDKAILNWETFNVGKNTTVNFKQQADWAVLNRINDPRARPSQIQGQIKADGSVMIVNANGVVFSGSSQVNVRNLVAVAGKVTDAQFRSGLYGANDTPTFTNAMGKVLVEQGAQIYAAQAASSTESGGYVLLAGQEVHNAGIITTPNGQTVLAAGDSFVIKRGQGTEGNQQSTTRGNDITARVSLDSPSGAVSNTGLISAATGDITLTGTDVKQAGVALASTSVNNRGTVHLNARGQNARVVLAEGATTAILLDDSATALDSQRDALLTPINGGTGNIVEADKFRRDQSLLEIDSAGTADFHKGSITLATGGQVAVNAATRTLVREGAIIDVSGAVGVKVAMESNTIKINVQGNEMRDASVNRDSNPEGNNSRLSNRDVWVDVRELIRLPAGTGGYGSDRWYTAGGLLEVGGYLGTLPHGAGEWMSQGGTVSFTGRDVITKAGSQINVSGGTLDVQDGVIRQSWLRGADNRLYEVSRAPGDVLYTGLYQGYEARSERWDVTRHFYNALIAPRQRFEQGYTVGRDAGRLVVGTRNALLEGDIVGDVYQGARQTEAARAGLDGYRQSQYAAPQRGQLIVGSYTPYFVKDRNALQYRLIADANTIQDVILGDGAEHIAAGLDIDTALPESREGTLYLDTDRFGAFALGSIQVAADNSITVNNDLAVSHGGEITLYSPQVDVNADITARAGRIQLGNVLNQIGVLNNGIQDVVLQAAEGSAGGVKVAGGAVIQAGGLWSNLLTNPADISALPYQDGGSVSVRSTGEVILNPGSLIDVSSGAAVLADRKQQGGRGGDVLLEAAHYGGLHTLALAGVVRGYGVNGGGTLDLRASRLRIGRQADGDVGTLMLDPGFFGKGFSDYQIAGALGLTVADGEQVDVTMPVYRYGADSLDATTDTDASQVLKLWTPPLYQDNPQGGVLRQRAGASLTLRTGTVLRTWADLESNRLVIGRGAVVNVDPGQRIMATGPGNIEVHGRLNAWGGAIEVLPSSLAVQDLTGSDNTAGVRSIWIGESAVLDAAGRSVTAIDAKGRRYGVAPAGGTITIGGKINHDIGEGGGGPFVVVREGALIDASGAQAMLDIVGRRDVVVAGGGGTISIGTGLGLYLHGAMKAAAGGVGAAGGTLDISLGASVYSIDNPVDRVAQPTELTVSQKRDDPDMFGSMTPQEAADGLVYGRGKLSIEQIKAGGFGNLGIASGGQVTFAGDIDLSLDLGARFYALSMALGETAGSGSRIAITAPYLRLAGAKEPVFEGRMIETGVGGTSARATDAVLSLSGALIDLRDNVRFSASGTLPRTTGLFTHDRRGFAQISLNSTGDIRIVAPTNTNVTRFTTANALTMTAAQIYPTTHAAGEITADSIRIGRTGVTPALPYSAFGKLSLYADIIDQGGVLRAPLGLLQIGQPNAVNNGRGTSEVNLLADSITSVSGAGLVMPYGGTVDGISYEYAGTALSETLLGAGAVGANLTLAGQSVAVAEGAIVDVSGGGTLTGAAFISGRGGSVDVLRVALFDGNPGRATIRGGSGVYALVPSSGSAPAPLAGDAGAGNPMVGQQITLDVGVPGLAAGTYTLMPSTYALLPGAFRVEIADAPNPRGLLASAAALGNGSHVVMGRLGVANSGVREALTRPVILTPADKVRNYSQYNETSFNDFALADAARLGVPRIRLPFDAQQLSLIFSRNFTDRKSFAFNGSLLNTPADGGWGGQVVVLPSGTHASLEIVKSGMRPTADFDGITLEDASLNSLNAGRLLIGGSARTVYGQSGNYVDFQSNAAAVAVRSGAALSASDIFLVAGLQGSAITVEQGAVLNTLGKGNAGQNSRDGFVYAPRETSVFAVSNSHLTMLSPVDGSNDFGPGRIDIGTCTTVCSGTTQLYSEGTIVAATNKAFNFGNDVRYGTRNLTLAVGGINIGSNESLEAARGRGVMPDGLELNQELLNRLSQGDTRTGAPALETLTLTARESINFFGTVALDTMDPATGKSRLANLVMTSGGFYGHGEAADVATIRTANFTWNGSTDATPAVMAGGAGTGSGTLNIDADRIEFGFGPEAVTSTAMHNRLALGFANVKLTASDRVTANHAGALSVYRARGAYTPGTGFAYSGGDLTITAPLITVGAGANSAITAGGAVRLNGTGTTASVDGLGGTLSIRGETLELATAIVLPSGKLTLGAIGDLMLADVSRIDMAGREVAFDDVKKYSWGGEVILDSKSGNIRQAASSVIDLSARNNNAGALRATALADGVGLIDLRGRILGSTSGQYDAGGSIVPYQAGSVDLRGQRVGDFVALNRRLNDGAIFGARAFQIKQGDLTIGDELKARSIGVSLDGGALTVAGKVDASGPQVGSIRLYAANGLTLLGTAMLDAHGTVLRVDSYGKIIDSPNRAMVELGSGAGTLTLAAGARIDLRNGTGTAVGTAAGQNDGLPRGTLDLYAPRLGTNDIAIDARGMLDIVGARSISVNAVRRYDDSQLSEGTETTATGRPYRYIDQAWMKGRHDENTAFINAALDNHALMGGKLAGLNNTAYRNVLHIRPTVEVASSGDLVVRGDIDLSGYRYRGLNPLAASTAINGAGEVGSLVLRSGGDLNVYGSITDGFASPPDDMPEKDGWVLLPGEQLFNTPVVVPRAGIVLHPGSRFRAGETLNYDLPITSMNMAGGTRLPVAAELTDVVTLPANTVLAANILNADGSIAYAAGTRVAVATELQAGMVLGAGTLLTGSTSLGQIVWPKGVPLPHQPADTIFDGNPDVVRLSSAVTLPMGGLIPAGAWLELGAGVQKVELRPGGGKSWALAQMLPEGSQSWSLRLVAGADAGAADNRLVNPNSSHSRLQLADTHYGTEGKAVSSGGGVLTFTEEGAIALFGDSSFAGLTEVQLVERIKTEFGVGSFEELFGLSFTDICTSDATLCAGLGGTITYVYSPANAALSVLRTGTGDLELISAGDLSVRSLYGVYTAGSSTISLADARANGLDVPRPTASGTKILGSVGYDKYVDGGEQSLYRAWYPDGGGNLSLSVGGNLTGDLVGRKIFGGGVGATQWASSDIGNWLWRQSAAQGTGAPTAWWINYGTYATAAEVSGMLGFTGFGTLGGGNLSLRVDGDAGMIDRQGDAYMTTATRSQGLVLAVGSTGRVIGGELFQTGGGDMDVRIGGGLNPTLDARAFYDGGMRRLVSNRHDLNGVVVNLRGTVRFDAGSIGGVEPVVGPQFDRQDLKETRAYSPFVATLASATGGLVVAPGDATVRLNSRSDLVLGSIIDGGRVPQRNPGAYVFGGHTGTGEGFGWFSLWTDRTAVDIFSAGGNLAPNTALGEMDTPQVARRGIDVAPTDGRYVYPSIFRAVAAGGSIYAGQSALYDGVAGGTLNPAYSLMLAPGENGVLQMLAADSIYASGYAITPSGADMSTLVTPFRPAFVFQGGAEYFYNYVGVGLSPVATTLSGVNALFGFGANTGGSTPGANEPARFYARDGDIVGLRTGEILAYGSHGMTLYEGARPVWMKAGRDIVNSGTRLNQPTPLPREIGSFVLDQSTGNLFVHAGANDVSMVQAGRDVLFSSFNVAGPGTLEVTAGRNIAMDAVASVTSIGPVIPGDKRPGASLALMAGATGDNWHRIRDLYLDPARLADPQRPLADQTGSSVKGYGQELAEWLSVRYDFTGTPEEALAYFDALAPEQQRIFARKVYFAELRAGGREYNDADGPRFGSYLRGRNAIAALFPEQDAAGQASVYRGDILMYGAAGVHTNVGGNIQMLTPGGQQVFGVAGETPPSTAGVVTRGAGDIQLYSLDSILLGQSRIMTTFGGDILAWSGQGDINAGRGSKTTIVYTPPRRVYDQWGNVTLSPVAPSTGAGIATLNPIAEVAPGDIDLVAPLGTIDAGEAGIRVSGNINIAALQVVNAANIQVQGDAAGIPVVTVVNTGALTAASAASASAAAAAQETVSRSRTEARQNQPSIFSVHILGFGSESAGDAAAAPGATSDRSGVERKDGYRPDHMVQILGRGSPSTSEMAALSADERRHLGL